MATVSVRFNAQEQQLFSDYCALKNIPISTLLKQALSEKIEDEMDIKMYDEAMSEFKQDPTIYPFDEVKCLHGF